MRDDTQVPVTMFQNTAEFPYNEIKPLHFSGDANISGTCTPATFTVLEDKMPFELGKPSTFKRFLSILQFQRRRLGLRSRLIV